MAAAPPVSADHGLLALYATDDGSFFAIGVYESGSGDHQTWAFTCGFASSNDAGAQALADVVGSIEAGFTSTNDATGQCISAGGTGHQHDASVLVPDHHDVIINGQPGTVTVL